MRKIASIVLDKDTKKQFFSVFGLDHCVANFSISYACVIFDVIIRSEKSQRILSECTLTVIDSAL